MPVSVAQLSEQLIRSGLLPEEQIRAAAQSVGGLPEDASSESLAKQLVRDGRLTLFQAQQAVNGKAAALILGSYVILEKLGQGGMGQVFKARHRTMKREVALKVISSAVVKDETSLRRFQREVEAAAQLNHPHIVTAHDAGEYKGTHFLVMELVRGSDLSSVIKKSGPMKASRAVQCVLQAARGLAYAHSNGIVHRDIKPANLLLDESGTIKILDMGLARFEEAGQDHASVAGLTGTGMLMGTIDYMSPEQAMDSKTADARSDIYSLGCTLYFLLTGRAVYEEDTVMKRLMAHQAAPIPRLPVLDSQLQAIFERCIAKRPEQRYQSTDELVRELQAWLTQTGEAAVRSTAEMPVIGGSGSAIPAEEALRDNPTQAALQTLQTPPQSPPDTTPSMSAAAQTVGSQPKKPTSATGAFGRRTGPQSAAGAATKAGTPATVGAKKATSGTSGRTNSGDDTARHSAAAPADDEILPAIESQAGSLAPRRRTAAQRLTLEGRQPPGKPPRKKMLAACGGGAVLLALLGIIVITLRGKDGRETVIRVPEGTAISVDPGADGSVDIARVSEDGGTNAEDMPDSSVRTVDSPSPEANVVPDWVLAAENNSALQFREGSVEFPTLTFDKLPQWTIEFQVSRAADSRTDEETLLSTFGQSDSRAIVLRIWGDDCVFGMFDGKSSMYKDLRLAAAGLFGREATHHVAIAFDGLTQTLYFDGQPQGSAAPEQPTLSAKPLCLGNLASGHDPRAAFRGWVDELRISNIVRYTAAYEPQRRLAADSNTIALYHFDEGRGDRLHDVSGHGHHGIIQNAEWISLSSDGAQPPQADGSNSTSVADGTNAATAMPSAPLSAADASAATPEQPGSTASPAGAPVAREVVSVAGTLAPAELRLQERSSTLPPFENTLRPGQPLGEFAAVSNPAKVNDILSWSVEPVLHRGHFSRIAVSKDDVIATGGADNSVRLWTKDWQLLKVLPGHANVVCSVAFSPDGRYLASVSPVPRAFIAVWDVASGQLLKFHNVDNWFGHVRWLPDNQHLIHCSPNGVERIHAFTGEKRADEIDNSLCGQIELSPDGSRMVVNQAYAGPQIIDTANLSLLRQLEGGHPNGSVDWSADGKWIVVSTGTGTTVLDSRSFQPRHQFDSGGLAEFSPDSTMLAVTLKSGLSIRSTQDWSEIRSIPIGISYDFTWSPDNRQLLTTNGCFDVQTGQPTAFPGMTATQRTTTAVSADGLRIATHAPFRLRIWDGENGQLLRESQQETDSAEQLLWQPQGSQIARVVTRPELIPHALTLIDSETGAMAHNLNGHQGMVWRAAWAPDGTRLASVGEDGTCRIWDAATGRELHRLTHADPLWWVQWCSDGTKLATGSSFSAIAVWDAADGKLIREFKTLSQPMKAPRGVSAADGLFGFLKGDSQLFYIAGDSGIEALDIHSGQITSLGQVDLDGGNRLSAAWSKDFGLLGIFGGYNEFHLYRAGETRAAISIRYITSPHWLADGRRILGGDNATAWIGGYDLRRKRRLGVLIPELPDNTWAALSSDGHYTGAADVARHIVVVALHKDGRLLTMSPEEFEARYAWKNDPAKVRLLK